MKISVKRIYEKPAASDGCRILVDRLWPRGVSKAAAKIDLWAKGIAPSDALRKWFHADPEARYAEFSKKYARELARSRAEAKGAIQGKRSITILTASKDVEHSHVPTLVGFLKKL